MVMEVTFRIGVIGFFSSASVSVRFSESNTMISIPHRVEGVILLVFETKNIFYPNVNEIIRFSIQETFPSTFLKFYNKRWRFYRISCISVFVFQITSSKVIKLGTTVSWWIMNIRGFLINIYFHFSFQMTLFKNTSWPFWLFS